ncbi:hypothetical protein BI344_20905 [Chromobacterium sphagni]|uniref:Uncharacterized protein n=1 Tax=Chromobacterium sphagni TaxID=1903179 RepID=A0ABX3C8X7_9NEIS|nr:hypothetical protein BI344_20905 [Chromobacterium sphagni]
MGVPARQAVLPRGGGGREMLEDGGPSGAAYDEKAVKTGKINDDKTSVQPAALARRYRIYPWGSPCG